MERGYNFSNFNHNAGVSYNTDDMSLREHFARYGEVLEGNLLSDSHNLLVFHHFRQSQYKKNMSFSTFKLFLNLTLF
jgi:hypothetical protein